MTFNETLLLIFIYRIIEGIAENILKKNNYMIRVPNKESVYMFKTNKQIRELKSDIETLKNDIETLKDELWEKENPYGVVEKIKNDFYTKVIYKNKRTEIVELCSVFNGLINYRIKKGKYNYTFIEIDYIEIDESIKTVSFIIEQGASIRVEKSIDIKEFDKIGTF